MKIESPGIYEVPELAYHADPVPAGSFSSTMAKQILKSPAHLRHYLDSPRVEKKAFDFGHAVHAGVLGVGLELVEIPESLLASNGAASTKAAKDFIAEARLAGQVPLKASEIEPINAAIEAVRSHPIAGPLFAGGGKPEQSAFAVDPATGMWLRARFDWITPSNILVDLKTAVDGEPVKFERDGRKLGYDVQQEFYKYAYELATGEKPRGFIFVTVHKDAPHLVDVHEPPDWAELGASKMRRAIDSYKRCLDTGEWPGRAPIINRIHAPKWAIEEEVYHD